MGQGVTQKNWARLAFGSGRRETDAISKLVKTENCTSLVSTKWQIPQYSSGLAS
jgi:hypothetical protein